MTSRPRKIMAQIRKQIKNKRKLKLNRKLSNNGAPSKTRPSSLSINGSATVPAISKFLGCLDMRAPARRPLQKLKWCRQEHEANRFKTFILAQIINPVSGALVGYHRTLLDRGRKITRGRFNGRTTHVTNRGVMNRRRFYASAKALKLH
jgi:hypothetical protein